MKSTQHYLGIDIGGTFTDLSLWRDGADSFISLKVPTNRKRPTEGVMAGLERLTSEHNIRLSDIGSFVHGTTIALNTLIERDGAKLGLLVTRGFRDLLVIQRLRMPTPYNWRTGRPTPLLPRRQIFEITGRLGPDGSEETPIAEGEIERAVEAARAAKLDGLVVCLMHAYRNSAHELFVQARIRELAPDLFVCCSHAVWPRMREYERALISIINAYVMPKIDGYLGDLESHLRDVGLTANPFITQSTGGIVSASSARNNPVETLLSGPAAGVMGAVHVAGLVGVSNFITLDIGGTSTDAAFVDAGVPRISQNEHVADFPLLMPVIGVSSIGAGGGSVISVDDLGVMRIGPTSVGADPGPACYGRGGTAAAVTDAFLVGGFLNPETFAGGYMKIAPEEAHRALGPLEQKLGRDTAATVEAVIQVAASSIYAELSNLAAKQGVSPRDYALMPYGGAGPLLAATVAEELGIPKIIVPAAPGTLCSLGALFADVSKPFVRSIVSPLDDALPILGAALGELQEAATTWLASDAPHLAESHFEIAADMRYVGQSYEIDVEVNPRWIENDERAELEHAFHRRHRSMFAHADECAPVEIVDLRLTIVGATKKPGTQTAVGGPGDPAKPRATREVVVGGQFRSIPVYQRRDLSSASNFAGPALVEQDDATIFVGTRWTVTVHPSGALMMESTQK